MKVMNLFETVAKSEDSISEKQLNTPSLEKILYHGGEIKVEKPEIRKGLYTKDFGTGFYVTNIFEQAERWATRKGKLGAVSRYSYKFCSRLEYKLFVEMTEEWLDFIVDCRNGESHKYDVVEGPMADDRIYNFITQFIDGRISRKQFWVMVEFDYPTHQVCLCSKEALDCLKFEGVDCVNVKRK